MFLQFEAKIAEENVHDELCLSGQTLSIQIFSTILSENCNICGKFYNKPSILKNKRDRNIL